MLNVANVPLHHHQNSNHQSSNLDVGGVDLHHHLHLNHNRNNKSSSSLSQKASYTTSASSSPLVLRVSKTAPNSKSSSSTSLASTSTNNTQQTPGTPSRIPVYSQNRNGSQQQQGRSRLNSLSDTLKHYHQLHHQLLQQQHQHQPPLNQSTKHSLSAHQLSDLPEDVKLMHIVHCHCSHNLNSASMPRSVLSWFYFQTRSNLIITFQIQDSRLYRQWPSKRRQLLFGALLFLDARHLDAQRSQAVQCLVIEWAAEQGEHRHCRHHHHCRQQQQLHSKQCCLSLRGVPAPL